MHNEADPDAASPTMFPVMFILEQGVDDSAGTSGEINGDLEVHTTYGLPLYWEYQDESGLTGERPLIRYSIEGVADFDDDGVMNFYDLCPDTGAGELADEDGCSWEQYDDDDDGVLNGLDDCPDTTTGQSVDTDGCAEYQKDTDEDGVSDADDACPGYDDTIDVDGDAIPDDCDSFLDIDDEGGDDGGFGIPAPSLAAAVAAVAVIALRRRR